jgi:hypothetical protein
VRGLLRTSYGVTTIVDVRVAALLVARRVRTTSHRNTGALNGCLPCGFKTNLTYFSGVNNTHLKPITGRLSTAGDHVPFGNTAPRAMGQWRLLRSTTLRKETTAHEWSTALTVHPGAKAMTLAQQQPATRRETKPPPPDTQTLKSTDDATTPASLTNSGHRPKVQRNPGQLRSNR